MRFDIHFHTEETRLFQDEKKDYSGEISIPNTTAKIINTSLTQDIGSAGGTHYIINCVLKGESAELNEVVDWILSKVKDKAKKITIGDIRGRGDWIDVDKEIILKTLNKWAEQE